ncbi:PQQ-binding-like beta-propeller repeat protein [Stackebrandtia nassauensis]|uniref:Uncharacterized protein n=1 Tax=Stackebrandtia nassauensis (strain DSM 44728 / CIP 108903 / NRRL B-16338 / NBRC 102104 / LLR-40K-21) TaxID=446470 RepID=D3Q085_STANL|nr:PQQ-binding-like beta-propeller repeat protein [Stackebrandtia nassauensis]ADD45614.1 hypothetical protein Snas_5988 [Stackebrandtia nassauensis DSM 44728]
MRRLLAVIGAVVALVFAAQVAAFAEPVPESLAAQPIAGATFKGPVHALAYARGKFFVGGEFAEAVADGKLQQRTHLAAVSPEGDLEVFSPELNGPVYALATGSHYLYVAGRFTEANGHPARHLARFSLRTGAVDRDFDVSVNALPRALELDGTRLYIGGDFNTVNGQPRGKVAAVSTGTGGLVGDFAPMFDRGVRTLEAANGKLYVGGGFTAVGDTQVRKLAALNPDSGAVYSSFDPQDKGLVYDIDAYDGRIYAATGGQGGRVMAYDSGGGTDWERITDGDVTAVSVSRGVVVAGGHFDRLCAGDDLGANGRCLDGVFAERGKLFAVSTGNSVHSWNPGANSVTGTHFLARGGGVLAAGGSFSTFAGGEINRRGLALFPY